jgi:putative ABC transport system ATP-binding protein
MSIPHNTSSLPGSAPDADSCAPAPALRTPPAPILGSTTPPLISARGLRLSFGLTEALRGIDLDVRAGEMLAVMGPSGSGKSTLLHVLAGVLVPSEGSVEYNGQRISALGEAARARLRLTEFGFVFQFGQLLPDLSAIDNVTIPLLLTGVPRGKALAQAQESLAGLGLAEHAEKRPTQLSGGQAQRIALARALITRPRVVFADEPTGSLDSLAAEHVMRMLTDTARHSGTTLVIVTHEARTAAWADREVIVRDGRISTGIAS